MRYRRVTVPGAFYLFTSMAHLRGAPKTRVYFATLAISGARARLLLTPEHYTKRRTRDRFAPTNAIRANGQAHVLTHTGRRAGGQH